jgi:hypothetical protein
MTPNKIPKKTAKTDAVASKQRPAKRPDMLTQLIDNQRSQSNAIVDLRNRLDQNRRDMGIHHESITRHDSAISDLNSHTTAAQDAIDFSRMTKLNLGSDTYKGQRYPISMEQALNLASAAGSPGFITGFWGITFGATALFGVMGWTAPAVLVFAMGAVTSIVCTAKVLSGARIVEEKDVI